jgi:hypothetical protein
MRPELLTINGLATISAIMLAGIVAMGFTATSSRLSSMPARPDSAGSSARAHQIALQQP